jgi:hypothetical protein
MSPDWSAKAQPVPYTKLDDPQSVNLYAYVRNNLLSRIDADGHYDDKCGARDKKCEKGLNSFDKPPALAHNSCVFSSPHQRSSTLWIRAAPSFNT